MVSGFAANRSRPPSYRASIDSDLYRAQRSRGGRLAVWSAVKAPAFERRLRTTGYRVEVHPARARGASGGASHYIYVGDVAADVRR
jgi:hypothetical protein